MDNEDVFGPDLYTLLCAKARRYTRTDINVTIETKSMIGHFLGASGGLEAAAAIRTISDGVIHPTINYENPDPSCDLDYVPNVVREVEVNAVLSNSFGFGVQNACVVIRKFEE